MKNKYQSNNSQTIWPNLKLQLILVVFLLNLIFIGMALASSIEAPTLLSLANKDRLINGFQPLRLNHKLSTAAQDKAQDMLARDYFEHYTPEGKSPWDFIIASGYDYQMAGENLAMDFKTAEGVHRAWMNSPSHKKNILREEYEEIGLATVKGEFSGKETIMVVEMFGKPKKENTLITYLIQQISNWLFRY